MARWIILWIVALATTSPAWAQNHRQEIPLEVEPSDPAAIKIVLLAGSFSKGHGKHEYFAGCAMFMKWLRQTPGVFPVMAAEGWPKNEKIFDGAKAVVFYMDGGGKQPYLKPDRLALIDKLAARGAGLVQLHQTVDAPADHVDHAIEWVGGAYAPGLSSRGHWDAEFKEFPPHPITRGVTPIKLNDGFLNKLRFVEGMKGITPLLRTASPKVPAPGSGDIVAWAYERPNGGRSFVATGADGHDAWEIEGMRKLVINGILWTAGLEIPVDGAPTVVQEGDLKKYWDPVAPKPVKAAKPAAKKTAADKNSPQAK
jgi:hypothetical protein